MSKHTLKTISEYMSQIGRKGGKKSRRKLDSVTARNMARLREARRLYSQYHAQCFWSYDPDYKVKFEDINWVAEQLKKNGDRQIWKLAGRLCR